ncbi:amidohydrolase family protein [Candidatus Poriferisocius sp.]|uniref:amidohydrolase family protein n=1 Tax=Candidatus Poriferisocius sp. TaxID=3101276 RepID=UPI003B59DA19
MTIVDIHEKPSERLLPDPEPQHIRYTLISVDDHLVEPPWLFEGRLPARFADRAPKVVERDDGGQHWEFDGQIFAQLGLNALVGRSDRNDFTMEPARFSDMRRGSWDIKARIHDMDLGGIWASICFPSQITGFCGRVYSDCSDPELGLAVTRAFNDWVFEEWWGSYPERIIPMGITWLKDAELAAAEIRRNAERGFVAVTLPEIPHNIGLPSIHSDWWDPVWQACEETDTVICLHVASSGHVMPKDPGGPALGVGATMFQMHAYMAAADWVWSGIPVRYSGIKIAMSEGGCGWLPIMYDRLKHQIEISGHGRDMWPGGTDVGPHEVLLRNFYYCTINDPSSIDAVIALNLDHTMVETDYPHADSTWPDCQDTLVSKLGHLSDDVIRKLTHENAARLFRHPLPDVRLP